MTLDIPRLIAQCERTLAADQRYADMPSPLTVAEALELLRMVPKPAPEGREEMARVLRDRWGEHPERYEINDDPIGHAWVRRADLVLSWRAEWERAARAAALEEAINKAPDVHTLLIGSEPKSCPCGNGRIPTGAYRTATDAYARALRTIQSSIAQPQLQGWRDIPVARPIREWSEKVGPVLWWKLPVDEPPYVGTPNDTGQIVELHGHVGVLARAFVGGWPGYHTHFTPLPPVPVPAPEPSA